MTLEARAIEVRYGETAVLRGVDIAVKQRRLLAIVGPNGAGKTTLLRVLAGLERPVRGGLWLEGRAMPALSSRTVARTIAYLPSGGTVEWPLAVSEVIGLGRLAHDRRAADDAGAVERAMRLAAVQRLGARRFDSLSGGEQARVLLARALAVDAPYLLADEPSANLDPRYQLYVMELLRELARDGRGIAVVLHDLTLATRFSDDIALLKAGRIVTAGAPHAALNDRALALAYGIQAARGVHDGAPYILPWTRLAGGADDAR